MQKRGLSGIVTTVILILLIIVAIAGIWAVVSGFISKGSSGITTEQFTINLALKSAKVNYTTGIATTRVVRNAGAGELTKIKFIVEDKYNSEVFDEDATDFYELAERTYTLDLKTRPKLSLPDVYKISIVPVYVGANGIENIGRVTDSLGNLNEGINGTVEKPVTEEPVCKQDSDCGVTSWINGSEVCNDLNTAILQYRKTYTCVLGFCVSATEQAIKESCASGTYCYNALCITEKKPCTNATVETDCGVSGWVGFLSCSADKKSVVQDWQEFICISNYCSSTVTSKVNSTCEAQEICANGDCFTPLECTKNSDCNPGKVCRDGSCVTETIFNNGTIRSAWPFGAGEYFDSSDLPTSSNPSIINFYVIFRTGLQKGCLSIRDFVTPKFEGGISYVRLNESKTNISDGDTYEIWETNYICTQI